ncbi:MAG TPA: rhodanese-like domain-containing protein [Roseiarcus sp.]|nr:rhodanese-like domain-containing protein [Roseiarcus sp.]
MSIGVANKPYLANSIDLDLETFANAVAAGEVTVVDVREPHEFAAGHIPGAVNLPLSRFEPRNLPAAGGGTVVLLCQAGVRSLKALNAARAAGRDDLRHYPGGMSQWRMYGGDVEA